MKTAITVPPQAVAVGLGVLVLGILAYKASKAASAAAGAVVDAVGTGLQAVNPANPENIFYEGVNAIGDTIALPDAPGRNADGSFTWGGWFYDVTHPATVAQIKALGNGAGGQDLPGLGTVMTTRSPGITTGGPGITAPWNTGGATGSW